MKNPRYTDTRYPHGYRPAAQTDIRKTFARVRAAQAKAAEQAAADAAEREQKLMPLKRREAK